MISLSLDYLQCVPCERRFLRTEPTKHLNDAYHGWSFIEGNTLGLCFISTLEGVFAAVGCAHILRLLFLILIGGVCLPRKKKVVEEDVVLTNKPTYHCCRCGDEKEDPVGTFYRLPHSLLYKANDCYAPLCKKCVNSLFDEFKTRYGSERTACILMCHLLDAPFYNSLFDSVVSHNNNFSVGLYLRQLNNKQFQFQNFCTTITSGELNKTAVDIQEEKEQKWSKAEIQAKDDCISVIGYDPFDGYNEGDRRYLFSELIKYFEDGIEDDPFKLSQIVQVVNNNNQIRQIDLQIARLNPMNSAEAIKSLNDIKVKLVSNNDKIAKENEISVKNRSNKDAGRNTLTFLMKDMREKDIAGAEANFYDQLRSPGTQWAADMSSKAIKENAFFDENDQQEIFDIQRELIDKFQKESDDAKEKYRLSLIENQRLKELLEDAGVDASVKDTDGDAV